MQNYEKYPEPRLIVVSHTFVYVTNRFQRSTGCQRRPKKKRGVTHVSPLNFTYQNYLTIVYYLT